MASPVGPVAALTRCCSDLCWCVSAVHLWRYRGGYPALTDCLVKLRNNKVEIVTVEMWRRLSSGSHLSVRKAWRLDTFIIEGVFLSSGVHGVPERKGKNADFKAKSAPFGVQFLE